LRVVVVSETDQRRDLPGGDAASNASAESAPDASTESAADAAAEWGVFALHRVRRLSRPDSGVAWLLRLVRRGRAERHRLLFGRSGVLWSQLSAALWRRWRVPGAGFANAGADTRAGRAAVLELQWRMLTVR
jgi:hypothetical protein